MNKIVPFIEMWMDLETRIQSKVRQKDKNKYHIVTHVCGILKKWFGIVIKRQRWRKRQLPSTGVSGCEKIAHAQG